MQMDSDILSYKCPGCGGALVFDNRSGKLHCNHCDSDLEVEAARAFHEEKEAEENQTDEDSVQWKTYEADSGNGDWQEGELDHLALHICPSCGAELVTDENTAATECLYCGNQTIIKGAVSGMYRPDYVIPFKLSKEDAKEKLRGFYHGKKLLPKEFSAENRIEKLEGIYVPFWLYDCDADAQLSFRGQRMRSWRQGDYMIHKTDFFLIRRAGSIGFQEIPADGSKKMDDSYMGAIEPFDYQELTEFRPAYLSGFLADKYDVTAQDNTERVNQRIKNSILEMFQSTVQGYSALQLKQMQTQLQAGTIRYVMLPVWMLNTRYRGKTYTFAMNGQTGKFVGALPMDKKKFWLWLLGVSAVSAVLLSLCLLFFLGGGQ